MTLSEKPPGEQPPKQAQSPPEREIELVDTKAPILAKPASKPVRIEDTADAMVKTFAQGLTPVQGRLIKAVTSGDESYVLRPEQGVSLTGADIRDFVDMAMEKPSDIVTAEKRIIPKVPLSKESHPEDWQWKGARARHLVAAAQLNQKVNEAFGTQIPVKDYELSAERLQARIQQAKPK
ncbi:MAG: hypothetical protein PHG85_01490 [Candidatus Altiarchaeota archaeon]|nr:hypothetical protein [Candidatus Altiarchaeota archaeon]